MCFSIHPRRLYFRVGLCSHLLYLNTDYATRVGGVAASNRILRQAQILIYQGFELFFIKPKKVTTFSRDFFHFCYFLLLTILFLLKFNKDSVCSHLVNTAFNPYVIGCTNFHIWHSNGAIRNFTAMRIKHI